MELRVAISHIAVMELKAWVKLQSPERLDNLGIISV